MSATTPPEGYDRITPYLVYEDAKRMMAWLSEAFGMVERHVMRRDDGQVSHAEMTLEGAVVMLGTGADGFRNPAHRGEGMSSLYIYVDDVDGYFRRACAAGAAVLQEPADQPYGDRRCGVSDPEGHHWYFASRSSSPG